MFMSRQSISFVLFTSLCLAPFAVAEEDYERALQMGDRLADQQDYRAALLKYKEAYEEIVQEIRGLDFKRAVEPKLMTRKDLQAHMTKLFDEEFSDDEIAEMNCQLKALDLVPADLDIRKTLIALYTEEVGGFYNPKNKNLFLIYDAPDPEKKRGIFSRLFGSPKGFNKEEQKIVLAHEMTHAAQDQHYDLQKRDAITNDDDMHLALSALAEGDATIVMFAEQQRLGGMSPNFERTTPSNMNFAFIAMKTFMPMASGKAYRAAPRILRDSLIFPYHKGSVFCLHMTNRRGWKGLDDIWANPPVSTEQILHPEKFLGERDDPVDLKLDHVMELVGDKWTSRSHNVLGEFQTQILLAGIKDSTKAAAGWDGDRFAVWEQVGDKDEADKRALVWLTTWDTPIDAAEFAVAYRVKLMKKLELSAAEQEEQLARTAKKGNIFSWQRDGQHYQLIMKDSDVAVIEGFDAKTTKRIAKRVFKAERGTKSFALPAQEKPESSESQPE